MPFDIDEVNRAFASATEEMTRGLFYYLSLWAHLPIIIAGLASIVVVIGIVYLCFQTSERKNEPRKSE